MFKKIKESLIVAASLVLFAVPVLAPVSVHAACTTPASAGVVADPPGCSDVDIQNNLCQGATLSATDAAPAAGTCTASGSDATIKANSLIKNIINIFSLVVGIVAVMMIIIAGFRYITSGGNDGNVSSAKNTILYAVIGLVIVALAQIIVRFVLAKATA